MTNTTVLMTDMAILVGIFLLGLLAKLFPRTGKNQAREHQQFARDQQSPEKR